MTRWCFAITVGAFSGAARSTFNFQGPTPAPKKEQLPEASAPQKDEFEAKAPLPSCDRSRKAVPSTTCLAS
eukprot:CAMPEP_0177309998 /NCGR_PEP_ID=MMETSP0368-20130122/9603_1 /TAXON_ID=447022 ORGANISM="Scrippsiella hangoei-like, Strain SHHI-4" /NCGR_SAMPLE_ID=MMETSP0368 /ASSEMBLY_ACC=CAM_ASM_000363 /LENGTH=70 /DNA_ID=CAMNT_0018768925 /DNA_START=186 /DNA_END=398 /DNA_ORIENTATION=-